MELRAELLKSIWYAFTALDAEKSGKVSKSQLKVLSHNLYTVLCIPHDPVALEEHFKDDDDGPVSSQGYMPYLNKYILDKVEEGAFVKESFDELCWTLTAKKNYKPNRNGNSVVSHEDAFKLWCLFNFLSEDKYPLVMVPDEGYLWKKGHLRRNWSERWFTLKPSDLSYYVSEERKEKKGSISLDRNSCVEILPDKDGKRCMFCVKTPSRTYEMSASDTRQRQEWTLAIQMAIRLQAEGKKSLHKDLKQKRREQREQRERKKAAKEEEMQRLKQLQEEKERKLQELELLKEAQRQAELLLHEEEERRQQQHEEMQRTLEIQLQEAEKARANMQAEMVLKEAEAERQRKRITELEEMQQRLQDALHQEVKARQDEEAVRYAQARLLNEEEEKLKQLMKLKEEQEEYIIRTQHEKLVLKQEMENKSRFLEEAQQQLEEVRVNRERVDQDVMLAQRKLQQASTNVKHWNVQMNRLMHPIAPGEKRTMVSGGFPGFNPALLSRRDSSLKLKQNLEKKKSDAMKNGSKENLNGEMEKQLQAPDKDHPSSETL
ncbi:differentially expressed in FDCP 6 homolog isoform X2 [Zootoca vivipara]|uniref:differentially expressed in FDCP 6 homolog isoform X2 n=1 Tax=Zootoca vivipara TaxID=8524 RepID=UPI0015904729|nr:differentially expressed in FDCP 6 homolog isoform X2 [Zootoca vivipara]